MANDKKIKTFTALDIEKYHKGLLSPGEMHDLEKAALDDPFLADAMEGYFTTPVNVSADIDELKKRLADSTEDKVKVVAMNAGAVQKSFAGWKVAAIIVVVLGAGWLVYQSTANNKQETIAQASDLAKEKTTTTDSSVTSLSPALADTTKQVTPGLISEQQKTNETNQQGVVTATVSPAGSSFFKADSVATYDNKLSEVVIAQAKPSINKDSAATNAGIIADKNYKAEEALKESRAKKMVAKDKEAGLIASTAPAARQESYNKSNAPVNNQAMNEQYRANNFRGRVTDAYNNAVPFANVTNVQDNVGTYTDARGYFNLTSPDTLLNVQVRGLGFNDNNISLRNAVPSNQVVMQEDKSVATQTLSNKKVNYEKYARDANMKIEGQPEPEDGWENYDSYLSNNLNIPDEVKTKQMDNGRVEVSFEVNKYGVPVNFKVEKSLCNSCDQEAIRLIKEGPKWKRKARKGRTTVTITF
ncbi:MAG TPA: carboxypeptidase-like regulatory domain-containing protein [Chitinophagaceae bacterium]